MAKKPVEKDYKVGDRVTVLANGENAYGRAPAMDWMVGKNYKILELDKYELDYVKLKSVTMEHQDSKVRMFHYSFCKRDLKRTHKAKVVAKPAAIPEPVIPPVIKVEPSPFQIGLEHLTVLKQLVKEDEGAGICSYSKKLKDDALKYRHQVKDACHARLGHYKLDKEAESLVLNIDGHLPIFKDSKENLAAYKLYVEYILAASPWKSCFKYYGITHALTHGIMMNLDKTRGQLASAAVALRQGSEYYNTTLPLFAEVLNLGHTGNTAWVVCSSVTQQGGKYLWNRISEGHRAMNGMQDKDEFLKFFKEGFFLNLGQKSYRVDNNHYCGIARHAATICKNADSGYYVDYKPPAKSIDVFLRDEIYKANTARVGFGGSANEIKKESFLAALPILDNLLNN